MVDNLYSQVIAVFGIYFGGATKVNPLEPQSRFGDKVLEIRADCPQNGTAVLKGLRERQHHHPIGSVSIDLTHPVHR